ncbi:MAG: hypothetical protein ACFCGT_25730 [Sandaracinaceae bacterium]
MTACLESTSGARSPLTAFRGRAAIVFYESRGHDRDNEALKLWCAGLVDEGRIDAQVVGVANLRGLGCVRRMVRPAVRAIAARYGTELWMDFDGALAEPPYGLTEAGAHVLLLDPDGQVCFRASGRLADEQVGAFLRALGATVGGLERLPLPSAA